ncbi:hypothetical protein CXB51_025727 [Gossypium anomalum]|uniref:Retrotransposon gag domain-containing protein n=1 Tax=Gossypium anomalum TaxID=47600 RepID=A0A8J6CUZ5_9ROSI|nr:hypothetical protein CXB51_025727 [Gossypium anomalum]
MWPQSPLITVESFKILSVTKVSELIDSYGRGRSDNQDAEKSLLDPRIDARLKDFQEGLKSEVRSEAKRREFWVLLLSFLRRKRFIVSPMPNLGHSSMSTRGGTVDFETVNTSFRVVCPRFKGENFRGWWSKLEQYFEAESVGDHSKIMVVMLHLEGKVLDWHHFFVQRYGELVTPKQQGSVDNFHDGFLSLLNQLSLPESYALSIFISNLKPKIEQYLRLFKPQSLMEGYNLARQFVATFIFTSRVQQEIGSLTSTGGSVQGHKCSKSQMYQLVIEPTWEQGSDVRSPSSEGSLDYLEPSDLIDPILESPVLLLHALQGFQGHNTIRFSAVMTTLK